MIKTVLSSSYDFGEQSARFIGTTQRGLDLTHLKKSAASSASLFKDVDVKPRKGHAVIHIVAMGAAPYYPSNKNGDLFYDTNREVELQCGDTVTLGKGLVDTHKTFETDAKVYKEHFNSKDDKVYGDVVKSRYNHDLGRVELLLSVPVDEWKEELAKLEQGQDVGFSMSGSLKHDRCNVCGNLAKDRSFYCNHLKYDLNQIMQDGHLVAAINEDMRFFDISGVGNPADRIAFGLLKAASSKVIGGAELSELLHIPSELTPPAYKLASVLRKLAEMEKTIEATASAESPVNAAAAIPDLDDSVLNTLKSARLSSEQTLGSLAKVKVVLSLPDFFRVLMGPQYSEIEHLIPGAEDRLPGVFSRMCVDHKVQDGLIDLDQSTMPIVFNKLLESLVSSNGLGEEPIRKRAIIAALDGKPCHIKSAAVQASDDTAETLAQLYGQYKAAVCSKHLDDNGLTFYSVLSHYISK